MIGYCETRRAGRRWRRAARFGGLHGHARLHLLQALHDHAVARVQAVFHQPLIADGARNAHRARLDLVFRAHDQRGGLARGVARQADLRGQQAIRTHALADDRLDVHARQQRARRVRNQDAQQQAPGRLIDGDILELQRALCAVVAAIFEQDLRRSARAARLELAGLIVLLERQPFAAGLADVHIDGVQLLHGGHRPGLVGRHQGPLRDGRLADTARDRGGDARKSQIDAGAGQCGLG